jgi:hypothetical protein
VTRHGGCACGAVRFAIDGPVRDLITCHCDACTAAAAGPWAASAVRRGDLSLEGEQALVWEEAAVSAYGARRGFCRVCRTYLLWDAPGRPTVSFGAALLDDAAVGLEVVAHIWVPAGELEALRARTVAAYREGLPAKITVAWHGEAPATG